MGALDTSSAHLGYPSRLPLDILPPRCCSLFNLTSTHMKLQHVDVVRLHLLVDFDLVIVSPFGFLDLKRTFPLHKKLVLVGGK